MTLVLIILLVVLLCGGGGWAYPAGHFANPLASALFLILLVVLLLALFRPFYL